MVENLTRRINEHLRAHDAPTRPGRGSTSPAHRVGIPQRSRRRNRGPGRAARIRREQLNSPGTNLAISPGEFGSVMQNRNHHPQHTEPGDVRRHTQVVSWRLGLNRDLRYRGTAHGAKCSVPPCLTQGRMQTASRSRVPVPLRGCPPSSPPPAPGTGTQACGPGAATSPVEVCRAERGCEVVR